MSNIVLGVKSLIKAPTPSTDYVVMGFDISSEGLIELMYKDSNNKITSLNNNRKGDQGIQGIQGKRGSDGINSLTWKCGSHLKPREFDFIGGKVWSLIKSFNINHLEGKTGSDSSEWFSIMRNGTLKSVPSVLLKVEDYDNPLNFALYPVINSEKITNYELVHVGEPLVKNEFENLKTSTTYAFSWIFLGSTGDKGTNGKDFKYEDFTPEQLESLKIKGDKGDKGEKGEKGEKGDGVGYTKIIDFNLSTLWNYKLTSKDKEDLNGKIPSIVTIDYKGMRFYGEEMYHFTADGKLESVSVGMNNSMVGKMILN